MSIGIPRRDGAIPSRPLLECLCRDENGMYPSRHHISRNEYIAGIVRDVESLLNARSSFPDDTEYEGVVAYGLPDCGVLCPTSSSDLHELEVFITHALEKFESRLCEVEAEAQTGRFPGHTAVVIKARLTADGSEFAQTFMV